MCRVNLKFEFFAAYISTCAVRERIESRAALNGPVCDFRMQAKSDFSIYVNTRKFLPVKKKVLIQSYILEKMIRSILKNFTHSSTEN